MNRTSILTVSGRVVNFANPDPYEIDIEDIAHALAHTCRFSGHTERFYSVAQHSVRVAEQVWLATQDSIAALWGLMHDAAEAYVTDVPKPLKRYLPAISDLESVVLGAIEARFDLPPEIPQAVHEADVRMLVTEARALCHTDWQKLMPGVEPYDIEITPLGPSLARGQFLRKYRELLHYA